MPPETPVETPTETPVETLTEAEPLAWTGETSVVVDSAVDAISVEPTELTAWLVAKTEVWVSVTGHTVVEMATTTVVSEAGQSVMVAAQEVTVWIAVL